MTKQVRPRLTPEEYEYIQAKKNFPKNIQRVFFLSDVHGFKVDIKAFHSFCSMIKDQNLNETDEVVINGDFIDLPRLSKHTNSLEVSSGITYTEIDEIEYCKELLSHLRSSTNARIIYRLGNHDERIASPKSLGKGQLEKLNAIFTYYKQTELKNILSLDFYGIEYDSNPVRDYYGVFSAVHGLSLAKNAPVKNIYQYWGSGTSGHSHRLNSTYVNSRLGSLQWLESGCMCNLDNVEYLPTGYVPDWANGFVSAQFDLREPKVRFYATTNVIISGTLNYNNVIYS